MKQLARRYVYWSLIDKDIERYVRSCAACSSKQNSPPKVALHPWEEPEHNWQRIHIDYAGPFQGYQFLVVIDAKSKWAEVAVCSHSPTSTSTIDLLLNIFARNGFPEIMVSDNATIFKSEEFTNFCQNAGIFQKFIAPGHPATNGLAERNVQTLKKRLEAMSEDPSPISKKVRDILFRYRATPLVNGKSPSEQYLGRQIRIRLDALRPTKLCKGSSHEKTVRQLSEGDRVQARYYTLNKPSWKFGTITKKLGRLHYIVQLDNGFIFKRHINQLRCTNIQLPDQTPNLLADSHSEDHMKCEQNAQYDYFLPLLSAQTHTEASIPTNDQQPSTSRVAETRNEDNINQRTSSRQRRPPRYHEDYIRH